MMGVITIVGLGPGDARYLTPAASEALASATDIVGYWPALLHKDKVRTTVRVEVA